MSSRELETPGAQQRHEVWRHPRSAEIHALLRRGRTPVWVAHWLEGLYPTVDEDGEPHPEARRNRKLRISKRTIDRYRTRFMPECSPGVDMIRPDIEAIIGHRPPVPLGEAYELQKLEALAAVAEHTLAVSLKNDAELEMVQPTTLEANRAAFEMTVEIVRLKGKMGLPGYELAPEKSVIDQRVTSTSRNVNVELHGREDHGKGEGAGPPNDPARVQALHELMTRSPEEIQMLVDAAESGVVDGTVEEDRSDG